MEMKGDFAFPKAPALLEPPHQIIQSQIRTLVVVVVGGLTPLPRCTQCILLPELIGLDIAEFVFQFDDMLYVACRVTLCI